MNAKENYLEAMRFGSPRYVPMSNEDIWFSFSFQDFIKIENWTDRWGVGWRVELEGTVPFPKENPLKDIEKLAEYKFPNPDDLTLDPDVYEQLKKVDRSSKLVMGNLTYFLFERAWALMGMEGFLMALIDYPDEMRYLLHNIASYARRVFDRYLELGVDGVGFSEDLGSQKALLMSPDLFREFLLPEYQYCFENLLKEKKIINFHSCGCIDAIAEDLASIGVTVLNPIQARANDLHKLKRVSMGKMGLSGGIDTHILLTGTPEQVREEVIRVMEILKPGGGYECGPDQHIPGIPEENMRMLWDTAREYGRY